MPKPVVDLNKCTGSGKCEEVCPVDVFVIENKKSIVKNPDACIEIGRASGRERV